ncbi:MAG: hypothetical protein IAF38_20585 [Bacteroidia bacterium]|nr:hypothetical protein [Bacteroidia bacterium]
MGTWGTDILENDAALDVYGEFADLYFERKDFEDIKALVKRRLVNKNQIPVVKDNTNKWLAYALICWECKVLDDTTVEVVDQILQEEIDSEGWENLWDKRKKAIARLRKKISVPAKEIKKIPKYFKLIPPFDAGDCVVFKYEDGMYGGAICTAFITDHKQPEYHTRHFANIVWYAQNKPTVGDFYGSHFLIRDNAASDPPYYSELEDSMNYVFTGRIDAIEDYNEMKGEIAAMEIIGKLKMKNPVKARGGNMSFDLSRWNLAHIMSEKQNPEKQNRDFPVRLFCELL